MAKWLISMAAAGVALAGAAFAQEEVEEALTEPPEPVAQFGDCILMVDAPEMPDPSDATADDRAATIEEIKGFQGALNEYRECLNAIADNEENEVDHREAALKEFNKTVKMETDMVADWQKFSKKYDKANK
ncbi:hypothetical protein [Hyphococcus sp.]|jgi:hypothetical protein|uniref:hypothetical protein n=1 Tax=Hyphococcus sp. TaxID=2038636 RepID=UPI003D149F0A